MTTPPPPPPSSSEWPSSSGTPPGGSPPPAGGTPPASPPGAPRSSGGRQKWWSTGRVIAAIVIVLVLMGGSAFAGFVAGAAWNGIEDVGESIAEDAEVGTTDDTTDDTTGGTTGPTAEGDTLQVGDTLTGGFDDEPVEHALTVQEATEVTIELRSEDFDTTLTVLDDAGTEVAYNDDIEFGEDRNSRVQVTLDPGTYTVVVDAFGFGEGGYELEVR